MYVYVNSNEVSTPFLFIYIQFLECEGLASLDNAFKRQNMKSRQNLMASVLLGRILEDISTLNPKRALHLIKQHR